MATFFLIGCHLVQAGPKQWQSYYPSLISDRVRKTCYNLQFLGNKGNMSSKQGYYEGKPKSSQIFPVSSHMSTASFIDQVHSALYFKSSTWVNFIASRFQVLGSVLNPTSRPKWNLIILCLLTEQQLWKAFNHLLRFRGRPVLPSFPRSETDVHCSVHSPGRVRKSGLCEDTMKVSRMAEQSEFPGRNALCKWRLCFRFPATQTRIIIQKLH